MEREQTVFDLMIVGLMKVEAQLADSNAINAASLRLEYMREKSKSDGTPITSKMIDKLASDYDDVRSRIDEYMERAVGLIKSDESEDIISKMNDEKEHSHED